MKITDFYLKWSLRVTDEHGTYLLEHEDGRTEASKIVDSQWGPMADVLSRVPPRFQKIIDRMNRKP